MAKPVLYAHPFSSYSQKVLIALYESEIPFVFRMLDDASSFAELEALWPVRQFPVLTDDGRTVAESSTIIEHLMLHHPVAHPLIPDDPRAALDVRFLDRVFDNHVMTPMQAIVFDARRSESDRDPSRVADAKRHLDAAYGWIDGHMADRTWAAGETFTMADCAAAPSLFYADWVHPIDDRFAALRAYRSRLLARPSVARAVDEARPFRPLFPPGAPDRD